MTSRARRGRGRAPPPAGEETVDVLRLKVEDMHTLLTREREERNFYQLERDKINTFWEITKSDLEEAKGALRNKDREMEELEENHQVQIKVYQQKVKHLLFDHQLKETELKKESEEKLTLQHTDNTSRTDELKKQKRGLKHALTEKQNHSEQFVKQLQQGHEKEKTKLREDYERRAQEMHTNYVQKTKKLRAQIELKRKTELKNLQNRKDLFIQELMQSHEKAFNEIKAYYYDITQNNMALIVSLKEHVEELRRQSYADAKRMLEMKADLQRALEPLEEKRRRVEALEKELLAYHSTKESLAHTQAQLRVAKEQLNTRNWEYEVLEQRFATVEQERDSLYAHFVGAVHEVQQNAGFKNLLLEKRLQATADELEKRDTTLQEVLLTSNLEPAALTAVTQKLEDVLDVKNRAIRTLEYELARVTKAHNDAVRVYEAKLVEYGIPVEDLGFRPLLTKTSSGPAGLVSG